jgi:hypothetical protein
MRSDQEDRRGPDEEIPRRGFWANLPKRSLSRVLLLLAMLAVIIYLQRRTGAIAGCVAGAFRAPTGAQHPPTVRLKAPAGAPARPAAVDAR